MSDVFSALSRRHILAAAGAAPLVLSAWARAAAAPLKIATIGAGRMGGALGTAFAKAGHPLMFSSRHPEELKDLVTAAGPNARAGTIQEAAAFGDVIALLVPYSAMPAVAKDIGKLLATKALVLDVSNPIPARDGEEATKILEEGPGAYLKRLMPGIRIVRGFNSIGFGTISNPVLANGTKRGVAMVGDDPKAIEIATGLVREIGFDPVVIGPLSMGKYLYRPSTYFNGNQSAEEIRAAAMAIPK